MTARPHLDTAERRARLGRRHRLAPGCGATSVADAAAAMTVLHATDPSSTFLQARARAPLPSPAAIDAELYTERAALRMLAMRRTLFLAAIADVPMLHHAASIAIGQIERRRTEKMFAEGGIPDLPALFAELESVGLAAVHERGEATTAELTRLDPRLSLRIAAAEGKAYEGAISISQKVFFHLALTGASVGGGPAAAGPATRSAGVPSSAGCPRASRHCRPTTPGRCSCGAGCGRSGLARATT